MNNLKWSKDLLDNAKLDLEASKLLYSNKIYPQAVFHLQQSVEKTVKSIYILTSDVDEKILINEIGHASIKVYKKIFEKTVKDIFELDRPIKESDYPSTDKIIRNKVTYGVINLDLNWKSISEEWNKAKQDSREKHLKRIVLKGYIVRMNAILREYRMDRRQVLKIDLKNFDQQQLRHNYEKFIARVVEHISSQHPEIPKEKIRAELELIDIRFDRVASIFRDNYSELFKDIVIALSDIITAMNLLYYLSIITQPHWMTRYPNGVFNPIEFYTKKLPLVNNFKKICILMDEAIKLLYNYHKKVKYMDSKYGRINN